jgi:hypothetical protein
VIVNHMKWNTNHHHQQQQMKTSEGHRQVRRTWWERCHSGKQLHHELITQRNGVWLWFDVNTHRYHVNTTTTRFKQCKLRQKMILETVFGFFLFHIKRNNKRKRARLIMCYYHPLKNNRLKKRACVSWKLFCSCLNSRKDFDSIDSTMECQIPIDTLNCVIPISLHLPYQVVSDFQNYHNRPQFYAINQRERERELNREEDRACLSYLSKKWVSTYCLLLMTTLKFNRFNNRFSNWAISRDEVAGNNSIKSTFQTASSSQTCNRNKIKQS